METLRHLYEIQTGVGRFEGFEYLSADEHKQMTNAGWKLIRKESSIWPVLFLIIQKFYAI